MQHVILVKHGAKSAEEFSNVKFSPKILRIT